MLFGSPRLRRGGAESGFAAERRFQLLALLGVQSGEWVTRDRAAALLWPDRDSAEARRNLRHVVFKAREWLGAEAGAALAATELALRWSIDTDLQAFVAAHAAGRAADALVLRRGPLLDGIEAGAPAEFAAWIAGQRARLDALWQQAATQQLAALADAPDRRAALAAGVLAVEPCDEAAATALIEAELARGNRAGAERQYRAFAARLAEQLGVEPSHRLRDLLREPPTAIAAVPRVDGDQGDEVGGFVGRHAELAEIGRRLAAGGTRLLTLVGPGGVGKSRLARRVVARRAPPAADWIALDDLGDADAAAERIARHLDIELRGSDDPAAQIGRALGQASRLLVLDNAEQVVGLAAFVERLLGAAPALTLLVTSREPLGVAGEQVLPLEGLPLPDEDSRDAEAAPAFDAVRLFVARARAAQRGFDAQREIAAVVAIVEAVDGLPLAIELAAGWVRLLPAEEIAHDLHHSISILERDPAARGAPARPEHRSMQAVLDKSWSLLAPRERDALLALAVFAGGFTHAAAREVGAVALPVLSSLADKCLLQVDAGTGRFRMHPLVAADAAVRAAQDAAAVARRRERHAGYYARQLADIADRSAGDHRPIAALLAAERANCDAAWKHAVASGRTDLVHAMSASWRRHFVASGRFDEGTRHFGAALTIDAGAALAEVRAALAWFAKGLQDADAATAIATEVLTEAEALGETRLQVDAFNTLGAAELLRGHWRAARSWFERSLATATANDFRRETATALNNLGLAGLCEGSLDGCAERFARAAAMQRELGDHVSAARAMHNLGSVHMATGDWPAAKEANDRALRYARAHDADAIALIVEFMQGATLIELDDLDGAERHLARCREMCRLQQDGAFELKADYYLARVAVQRGKPDAAAALFGAARRAHDEGWTYDLLYIALFVAEALCRRGRTDEAARIVAAVRASPEADAFVHALVAGPEAAEDAVAVAPFDHIAALLVQAADLDTFCVAFAAPRADKR